MTKFEFFLPYADWPVNPFFEGQGYTVETRVRTVVGHPWSVVIQETLTVAQRNGVINDLRTEGCTGLVRSKGKPAGTPEQITAWREALPFSD